MVDFNTEFFWVARRSLEWLCGPYQVRVSRANHQTLLDRVLNAYSPG